MNKRIYTILSITIVVLIGIIFLAYSKKDNIYKEEVKEELKMKTFAIMIEKADGKYIEYRGKEWPKVGYVFNKEKTTCVDRDKEDIGNIVEFDVKTKVATMKSKTSSFCTLYFLLISLLYDFSSKESPTPYNSFLSF